MKEVLLADRVDHPKLVRLQKETFMSRRKWMQSLPTGDVHSIVSKYPILKEERYIEREFDLLLPGKKLSEYVDNFDEVLTRVEKVLGTNNDGDEEEQEFDVLDICAQLSKQIKMLGPKSKPAHKPVLVNRSVSIFEVSK